MIITLDNYKTIPRIEILEAKIGYLYRHNNDNNLSVVESISLINEYNDPEITFKELIGTKKNYFKIWSGNQYGVNIGGFYCISLTNTFQINPIIVDSPAKPKTRFELINV